MLKSLNLSENEISVLDDLHRTMPQYLQDLNIGSNVITDLRQVIDNMILVVWTFGSFFLYCKDC